MNFYMHSKLKYTSYMYNDEQFEENGDFRFSPTLQRDYEEFGTLRRE